MVGDRRYGAVKVNMGEMGDAFMVIRDVNALAIRRPFQRDYRAVEVFGQDASVAARRRRGVSMGSTAIDASNCDTSIVQSSSCLISFPQQ